MNSKKKISERNEKSFENRQNIDKIVSLTPKETQLSKKKIEWIPNKNFDKKKIFLSNLQNSIIFVTLALKCTKLSEKVECIPKKNFQQKEILFKNYQNIMKIVFLGTKATQLSNKIE